MSSVAEAKENIEVIGNDQFFKPGQKYSTPAPGNGDRVFYETLIDQIPTSEMAQEWCVAYGILEWAKAKKLYEAICKRKGKAVTYTEQQIKFESSPVKGKSKAATAAANKKAPVARKRKLVDDDIDDTGFEASGVWEGQGSAGI